MAATAKRWNFITYPPYIRPTLWVCACLALLSCGDGVNSDRVVNHKRIERAIRQEVISAYNLKDRNFVANVMALYPQDRKIVSASGGQVITSRDSLELGVRTFWQDAGSRMRNPDWQWTSMYIDVLSPESAVMTATYRVPHWTPQGTPHIIGGAWTAVFKKYGRRWLIVQEHLSDKATP